MNIEEYLRGMNRREEQIRNEENLRKNKEKQERKQKEDRAKYTIGKMVLDKFPMIGQILLNPDGEEFKILENFIESFAKTYELLLNLPIDSEEHLWQK